MLKEEFRKSITGKYDLFALVAKIAEEKDHVINSLEEFLYSQPERKNTDTIYCIPEPSRECAVLALNAIGTQASYNILLSAAFNHDDPLVRASRLKTLA